MIERLPGSITELAMRRCVLGKYTLVLQTEQKTASSLTHLALIRENNHTLHLNLKL